MLAVCIVAITVIVGFVAGGAGFALFGVLVGMLLAGAAGPLVSPRKWGPEAVSGAIAMVLLFDVGALLGLVFTVGGPRPPLYVVFVAYLTLAMCILNVLAVMRYLQRKSRRFYE